MDKIGKDTRMLNNNLKADMVVLFDGNCQLCRRTVAILKAGDIFHWISYISISDTQAKGVIATAKISEDAVLRDMHAVLGREIYKGYDAYRVIAGRTPFLWPIWPLLFIWPVTAFGRVIYRRVADSRTCQVTLKHRPQATG